MARTPVQARRAFMVTANRFTPLIRIYPWNVVDTELGIMVEPHQFAHGGGVDGTVPQVDIVDFAYDSLTLMDPSTFYSTYGTDGQQGMMDFNY